MAQYLQRLEALAGQSETPLFDGFWQRVIIQPDLFCAQTFDVGIVVSHSGGGRDFQLVEDLAKFECVYGRGHMKNIRDLLRVAEEVLFRATSLENLVSCTTGLGSNNVYLSKPQPTSGAKLEVVLNRLFAESVVMQPAEPKQARDPTVINTETARRLVGDELRRIGGLAYERIVVDTEKPVAIRDDEGDLHVLDVTLVTNTGAGNVVSGAYKTKATMKAQLIFRTFFEVVSLFQFKPPGFGRERVSISSPSPSTSCYPTWLQRCASSALPPTSMLSCHPGRHRPRGFAGGFPE